MENTHKIKPSRHKIKVLSDSGYSIEEIAQKFRLDIGNRKTKISVY